MALIHPWPAQNTFRVDVVLCTAHFGCLQRDMDPVITYLNVFSGDGAPPLLAEHALLSRVAIVRVGMSRLTTAFRNVTLQI